MKKKKPYECWIVIVGNISGSLYDNPLSAKIRFKALQKEFGVAVVKLKHLREVKK